MKTRLAHGLALTALALLAAPLAAQQPTTSRPAGAPPKPTRGPDGIEYQPGPFKADLGVSEIDIPKGYLFVAKKDMRKFNDKHQNITSGKEVGAILPETGGHWVLYLDYMDDGYVKDDEKNQLDADKVFKDIKSGEEAGNEERKKRGWAPMEFVKFDIAPFYSEETHNLTWALRLRSQGQDSINYESHILGRGGRTSAILACGPDEFQKIVPTYNQLIKGFEYKSGQKYSEFREGDKVAEYGLYALAAGGGLAIAAKTGLLAKLLAPLLKLGKFLIFLVVAAIAGIGAVLKKIFGRSKQPPAEGA